NVGPAPPDMTAPQITLTSPADGDTLASAFEIAFDASDDRSLASVELIADGVSIATQTLYPWAVDVPGGTLPGGPVRLKGVAHDWAGNQTETPEIGVIVKKLGESPGDLGTSCGVSSDCNGGGFCAMDGHRSFCSRSCNSTEVCPA